MSNVQTRPRFSWAAIEQKTPLIPQELYPWMNCRSSLSQEFMVRCDNFQIALLSQGYNYISDCEADILNLVDPEQELVREVLLTGNEQNFLFARTIMSKRFLQQNPLFLSKLATSSLRSLLFTENIAVREKLECTKLLQRDWLHKKASKYTDRVKPFLWSRRSLFNLNGAHLLISEVFLPNLPKF